MKINEKTGEIVTPHGYDAPLGKWNVEIAESGFFSPRTGARVRPMTSQGRIVTFDTYEDAQAWIDSFVTHSSIDRNALRAVNWSKFYGKE